MPVTIPKPPPETCREHEYKDWIVKVARKLGWRVNHVWKTQNQRGEWITTCSPGFPDLTLVRGDRLVFIEVKAKRGRCDPKQDEWLDALAGVKGSEVWVVDPTMTGDVVRILA